MLEGSEKGPGPGPEPPSVLPRQREGARGERGDTLPSGGASCSDGSSSSPSTSNAGRLDCSSSDRKDRPPSAGKGGEGPRVFSFSQ